MALNDRDEFGGCPKPIQNPRHPWGFPVFFRGVLLGCFEQISSKSWLQNIYKKNTSFEDFHVNFQGVMISSWWKRGGGTTKKTPQSFRISLAAGESGRSAWQGWRGSADQHAVAVGGNMKLSQLGRQNFPKDSTQICDGLILGVQLQCPIIRIIWCVYV